MSCGPVDAGPGTIDFPSWGYLQPPPWNLVMPDGTWPTKVWPASPANVSNCLDQADKARNANHTAAVLHTSYCLAEPLDLTCMMGLSVPLLLTVALCIILKTLLSVIVVYRLREPLLVTPAATRLRRSYCTLTPPPSGASRWASPIWGSRSCSW